MAQFAVETDRYLTDSRYLTYITYSYLTDI